jgi:hypothetical protein
MRETSEGAYGKQLLDPKAKLGGCPDCLTLAVTASVWSTDCGLSRGRQPAEDHGHEPGGKSWWLAPGRAMKVDRNAQVLDRR